ncbi:methyl methanesulfonate sensitivity 4 [Arctopsyche grandis]|uniref:methyl methanesulfonate sensitivity 4 n=1 Tax=Arctopsyche grandis TaxID=121162 RepID=UPI00406D8F84
MEPVELVDLCSDDSRSSLHSSQNSELECGESRWKDRMIHPKPIYSTLTGVSSEASTSGIFSTCEFENDNDVCSENFEPEVRSKTNDKSKKAPKTRKNGAKSKTASAEGKALKKAMNEQKKIMKPGECMKFIIPEISSTILDKPFATKVIETLQSNGVKHSNVAPSIAFDNCIGWIRKNVKYSVESNGQISTDFDEEREAFIVIVYDMSEMENLLKTRTLNDSIRFLKEASNSQITVLLYGPKVYFNPPKAGRKRKSKGDSINVKICENDLDYYLTKLLFEESVSCVKANNPEEFAQIILQFTKAVAEAPYKKEKKSLDEKADFYMRGDNKGCVKVNKEGNGLLQLWCQTLTKFPLVSLETAQAICQRFKSPCVISKTLNSISADEALKILAEIPVRRAAGPMAVTRRIGPELARKIYIYFTATDGEQLLN